MCVRVCVRACVRVCIRRCVCTFVCACVSTCSYDHAATRVICVVGLPDLRTLVCNRRRDAPPGEQR